MIHQNLLIQGPRGPAGYDGCPIGSILSFMGTSAPEGYLICDGTIYNIDDYSDLADFFLAQFGSKNYFGGNGSNTFAVPDLRNLFLRGYHGNASEQLSGEIGKKQEATEHPFLTLGTNTQEAHALWGNYNKAISNNSDAARIPNSDKTATISGNYSWGGITPDTVTSNTGIPNIYTSRPVNVAVLFCIKYTKPKTTLVIGDKVNKAEIEEMIRNAINQAVI